MRHVVIILGSLLIAGSAGAQPSAPDFAHDRAPHAGVGAELAASDASQPMRPIELVHFGSSSSQLDAADRAQLHAAARWLTAHPDQRLVIEGHTDRVGSEAYNDWLAGERATAVRDALVAGGADPVRLVVSNYGEAFPTSPDLAANRRVVIHGAPLRPDVLIGDER